jgi:hypothetical protein
MGRSLQQRPITPTHPPHHCALPLMRSTAPTHYVRSAMPPCGRRRSPPGVRWRPSIVPTWDATCNSTPSHQLTPPHHCALPLMRSTAPTHYVLSAMPPCGRRRSPPGVRWRPRLIQVARPGRTRPITRLHPLPSLILTANLLTTTPQCPSGHGQEARPTFSAANKTSPDRITPPPQILRKWFPALICCQVPDCVSR